MLRDGELGVLQEIRARGKEDSRAGGEDLIFLGTHTSDLLRYFAGDLLWVFSHISDRTSNDAPCLMDAISLSTEPFAKYRLLQILGAF